MRAAACFSLCLMLIGCAHLPNPFGHFRPDYKEVPADALKAVALDIERAVQDGKRDAEIAERDGVSIKDEAIQQAIRTRAARSALINEFLDTGFGIERKNGHLYIIRNGAYKKSSTPRQRDRTAMLVADEAADRWTIYEGIVHVNHFRNRALPAVQAIFHEARVQVMKEGQKYEGADGEPLVKGK